MLGAQPEDCYTQQTSIEARNINHAGASPKGGDACSSTQKAGNWRRLTAWWAALSVAPDHIKLQQPEMEGASNLNDPHSQTLPQAPPFRTRSG